jgi:hypothetical protein
MAVSSSRARSTRSTDIGVPVAKAPPAPPAVVGAEVPTSPLEWDWWTAENAKGWAGSLALHAVLLLTLACWYFAPSLNGPRNFDSRLAGSEHGVPEGEMLMGGLNTPVAMPTPPLVDTALASDSLTLAQLDNIAIEPETRGHSAASKESGGGGVPNHNPGAGDGDGFGLARFGEGGELIRGVTVKVGDPQFTLIWNTDQVDLDLHVIEPGGKEIYWEDPKGKRGGELDVDNTKGYGPENIYWLVESDGPGSEKVKGPGPPGTYRWFVVYWGGFGGIPRPTHWQVRVKHAGKVDVFHGKFHALNERSKTYSLKIEPASGKPPAPQEKDAGDSL